MTAYTPAVPVVNAGLMYVNDMRMAYATTTTMTVTSGACRDSTNTTDIIVSSSATINTAVNGLNGLDTGTIATNTFYAVHAIGSSLDLATPGYILSLSATAPTLPRNYDVFRRIGWIKTDGSAFIAFFHVAGNGSTRLFFWDQTALLLNAQGTADTFQALSLASAVPSTATVCRINWNLVPNTAGNSATFRATGVTVGAPQPFVTAPVAAKASAAEIELITNSSQSIDWKTSEASDALSVYVTGYTDFL